MFAHHDDAGLLVDDDAGNLVRPDAQLFNVGQQCDRAAGIAFGDRQADRAGVDLLRGIDTQKTVDRLRNAAGGCQVGIAQGNSDFDSRDISKSNSRSTIPPFGMRPLVGTPFVTEPALPCAEKPPTASCPWATK